MSHPRLEYAAVFDAPAAVFADPDAVQIVRMPALCVTTGALVGLDPFNIGCYDLDYAPYERTIRPGLYAGRACIDRATGHVAATWLQVRRAAVVRWELATPSDAARESIQLHEPGAAFAYEWWGLDAHGEPVALVSDFFSSFHACCPPGLD